MTISVAWIRKIKDCEELIFVSDSRLGGGDRWDECPKILTLERGDCAMSFAGDTCWTYPLMLQTRNALNQYNKIKSRAMDITDVNGFILNVINSVFKTINRDDYHGNLEETADLIFGGYSWIYKTFKMWNYFYSPSQRIFIKNPGFKNYLGLGRLILIGDNNLKKDFKERLRKLVLQKYGVADNTSTEHHFYMEPFEVIRDMLKEQWEAQQKRSEKYRTIGGAPQMIKVYQYMNSRPVGMYWPEKSNDNFKNRTLLGRRLFDFEDTEYWFMDPYTFYTNACHKNKMLNENNEEI